MSLLAKITSEFTESIQDSMLLEVPCTLNDVLSVFNTLILVNFTNYCLLFNSAVLRFSVFNYVSTK